MTTININNSNLNFKENDQIKGNNNILKGNGGVIKGNNNIIYGNNNIVDGKNNEVIGMTNKMKGANNTSKNNTPEAKTFPMEYNTKFYADAVFHQGDNATNFFNFNPTNNNFFHNIIVFKDFTGDSVQKIIENFNVAAPHPINNLETNSSSISTLNIPLKINKEVEKVNINQIKNIDPDTDEIAEENDTSPCIICFERKRKCAARPCNHFRFCNTCCIELKKKMDVACPVCREPVIYFESFF